MVPETEHLNNDKHKQDKSDKGQLCTIESENIILKRTNLKKDNSEQEKRKSAVLERKMF